MEVYSEDFRTRIDSMEVYSRDFRIRIGSPGENLLEVNCVVDDFIHDLALNLLVELPDMIIKDADLKVRRAPEEACPNIEPLVKKLKGVKIGPGFARTVLQAVGGPHGCPNISNMLLVAAPLAINCSWHYYRSRGMTQEEVVALEKRNMAGVCLAFPT